MRNLILSLWYRYKSWNYDRKVMKYFGCKPETIYVSKEAYDELVRRINEKPDPEVQERLRKLFERECPWNKQ
jgi:hypothetical protein